MFYLVTVIGSLWLLLIMSFTYKALRSRQWRPVIGTIQSTRVKEHVMRGEHDGTRTYTVEVTCQYDAEGKTYETSNISFGGQRAHRDPQAAEEKAKSYPPGSQVRLYCDPAKPQDAVLHTGMTQGLVVGLAVGVIILGVGIAGVINDW
jgi:hypothetical protein